MKQRTFHYQQGIALCLIMFIIAILAIIAAAIAAGSGSFTARKHEYRRQQSQRQHDYPSCRKSKICCAESAISGLHGHAN